MAQQQGRLREALRDNETQEVVVDLIAADNYLPRFLARALYRLVVRKAAAEAGAHSNWEGPQ